LYIAVVQRLRYSQIYVPEFIINCWKITERWHAIPIRFNTLFNLFFVFSLVVNLINDLVEKGMKMRILFHSYVSGRPSNDYFTLPKECTSNEGEVVRANNNLAESQ
jgi:hypothetical protein